MSDIKFPRTVLHQNSALERSAGHSHTMYLNGSTDHLTTAKKTKINSAVYYLITAYLYIGSISLFKYLITCLPTKASYYTSIPQLALLTNFPLLLHKTLVCFPRANMSHYYSACREASSNDRLRDPNGGPQLRLAVLERLLGCTCMSLICGLSTCLNVTVLHIYCLDWNALSSIRFENVLSVI